MWLQVPFTTVHSGETPSSHQETTNTLPFRWPWSLVGRTSHAISCVWMLSERELGQTSLILKKITYIELYRYKHNMILSWTIQFSSLCFSRIWGNFWFTSFFKEIFHAPGHPASSENPPGLGAVIPRDICETQIPYESELKGLTWWETKSSSKNFHHFVQGGVSIARSNHKPRKDRDFCRKFHGIFLRLDELRHSLEVFKLVWRLKYWYSRNGPTILMPVCLSCASCEYL